MVDINLGRLQSALRNLKREQISRADREFLVNLLDDLSTAINQSPTKETNDLVRIDVAIQAAAETRRTKQPQPTPASPDKRVPLFQNSSQSAKLQEALQRVLQEVGQTLGSIHNAIIYRYDAGRLEPAVLIPMGEEGVRSWVEPRPRGLTYTVARLGKPIYIEDMTEHPLYSGTPYTGAIIGLPLKFGSRVVGVMTVWRQAGGGFSSDETHILEGIASQAAGLLEEELRTSRTGQAEGIDPATGLNTPQAFQEGLEKLVAKSKENGSTFALVMMDMGIVKQVSSLYGAQAGNYTKKLIAASISQALRETDSLANYSNDQWSLLLEKADRLKAFGVAERVQEVISKRRFTLPERAEEIFNLSIGIAVFPDSGADSQALLDGAALAMQQARQEEPGSIRFAPPPEKAAPPGS
ncbi:MAG: diguanylate cyclase [Chloroflexi bacterium]|nr:diguanylate cyclase [Chloroflexota bacterium]